MEERYSMFWGPVCFSLQVSTPPNRCSCCFVANTCTGQEKSIFDFENKSRNLDSLFFSVKYHKELPHLKGEINLHLWHVY